VSAADPRIEADGRRDRAAGFVLLLAGAATALEARTFNVAFMTDPVGPKALPFLVAVALAAAGLRLMASPRASVPLPGSASRHRIVLAAGTFMVYGLALPWIGFFVSTTLVVAVLGGLFRGPKLGSVVAGAGLAAILWLLFVPVLSLPLPVGVLWIR